MSQQDVYLVEELKKNKIEDNFRLLQGAVALADKKIR